MKRGNRSEGKIFIIPSPVGNNNIDETLPVLIKETIAKNGIRINADMFLIKPIISKIFMQ